MTVRITRRAWWIWWVVAVGLAGVGVVLLWSSTQDVRREAGSAGDVPVRIVAPAGPARGPAVVLAHGFAGSAAMMDPMASALARAGHVVVLPDLPGHGGNGAALRDGGLEPAIARAVGLASALGGGPVAVVGHSMGAGAVTAWASDPDAQPQATVAVSLPRSEELPADPARPPNLLLLWGAAEQQRFADAALSALRLAHPGGEPGRTYGSADDGTARRAQQIPGAEHITVVYRAETARAVAAWVDGGEPRGDARWVGLALVLLGGLVATRPALAGRLPTAVEPGRPDRAVGPEGTGPGGWSTAAWLAGAAGIAGVGARLVQPVVEGVPVAVSGYLMAWFAGGAAVLALVAGQRRAASGTRAGLVRGVVAGVLLAVSLALPARLTWAAFDLVGPRGLVLLGVLAVSALWFWSEARLLTGSRGWRRAVLLAVSRIVVVVGLLTAVLLLGAPGFLTLTVPLVIPILGLLGVVAWWARDPAGAAAAQAVPLALAIATTFPIVG